MKEKRKKQSRPTKSTMKELQPTLEEAPLEKLQPQRVQRRPWLLPGIYVGVIAVVIIIFAFIAFTVLNSGPSAAKTLAAYCSALKTQDYGTAYKQIDPNTQKRFSVVEFVHYSEDNSGAGSVADCAVDNVQGNDALGNGNISYTYANGRVQSVSYKLKSDANGNWKITNVSIPTPMFVLTNYCNYIKLQDYQSAYKFVSNDVKVQESEQQFAVSTKRFDQAGGRGIAACSVSNIVNLGAQATGTVTYTSTQGKIAVVDYVLVEENGAWRLDSEQPRVHGSK